MIMQYFDHILLSVYVICTSMEEHKKKHPQITKVVVSNRLDYGVCGLFSY